MKPHAVKAMRPSGNLLAVALIALPILGACDSRSPASPSPTPTGTSTGAPAPSPVQKPAPPPAPALARYHLTGRVTTEAGSPVPGAGLWVEYNSGFRYTQTNGSGEYEFEFDARPLGNDPLGHVGYVYAFSDVHEVNLQWVPLGADGLVQNFSLRPRRVLAAGESTSVPVGPTSSFCKDLEDLHAMEHRCEIIHVESRQAGTLDVDLRADGAVVPVVMWATSGDYIAPVVRLGPSTASFSVRPGKIRIFVGIPEASPTERIDVVTSWR